MSDGNGAPWEINLEEKFGEVVVKANGAQVRISADGSIQAYPSGDADVYTNGSVAKPKAAPHIGEKMEDGTIYAGTSPDTGRAMYTTPKDIPLTYVFDQAVRYAAQLDAHNHQDWRVPTKGELNVLFSNRAAIGGFDESASNPAGWHWSSSRGGDSAWGQRFRDGYQDQGTSLTFIDASLRCVR